MSEKITGKIILEAVELAKDPKETYASIARTLGKKYGHKKLSRATVRNWVRSNDPNSQYSRPRADWYPKHIRDRIIELRKEGHSYAQIARIASREYALPHLRLVTVAKHCKKAGLGHKSICYNSEIKLEVYKDMLLLYDKGHSAYDIEKLLKDKYGKAPTCQTICKTLTRYRPDWRERMDYRRRLSIEAVRFIIDCIRSEFNYSQTALRVKAKFGIELAPGHCKEIWQKHGAGHVPVSYQNWLPTQIINAIIRLAKDQYPTAMIVREINKEFAYKISPDTVNKWYKRLGLKSKYPRTKVKPEIIDMVINLEAENPSISYVELAKKVNEISDRKVNAITVKYWVKHLAKKRHAEPLVIVA